MFEPTSTLDDVVPEAREPFEKLLELAASLGLGAKIRRVGRTCADQAKLSALGPGVTQAALCRSWHVLGRAVDLTLAPNTCASYQALGELWEGMGGIWGGRWKQFGECGDAGHYEWADTAAVPEAVCPSGISVAECEEIRQSYLAQAFSPSAGSSLLPALALFGGVVLVWWVWK